MNMRIGMPACGILLAALLTLASGLVYARVTHRWGASDDMEAAGRALESFPAKFGPAERWQMRSDETLDESNVKMLQCAGYVARRYENRQTGESVQVLVLLGPTGPISVHTPEICYPSREYAQEGSRQPVAIQDSVGNEHRVWAATFVRNDVSKTRLHVYYGWSTGGVWSAPGSPRFAFAGRPHLYKIQLTVAMPSGRTHGGEDAGVRFLRDFIPAVGPLLGVASRVAD
jgi:hypothetical protein